MTDIHTLITLFHNFSLASINIVDLSGASVSIFASLFCVANHALTFPISLLASIINMFNYHDAHLLAHSYREIFQCMFLIYGWINWQPKGDRSALPITHFSHQYMMLILLSSLVLSLAFQLTPHPATILTATQNKIPYFFFFDALATIFHIFGLYLLSQRKIECWLVWIVVDLINLPLYVYSGLFFSAIKVTIYLFLATIGYLNWSRIRKEELLNLTAPAA